MADQAILLKLRQDGERLLNGAFGGAMSTEHDAQIDHLERIQAEIAQVVMHRLGKLIA